MSVIFFRPLNFSCNEKPTLQKFTLNSTNHEKVRPKQLYHCANEFQFFIIIEECYVVRPDNQTVLHQLGAKGSICLLHISPGGVTLVLQVGFML